MWSSRLIGRGDDSHRKPIGTLRGMPEGDDPEGASGPPPHPLDRVWFHPTELSAYMSATASRRGHRTWFVGGAALAAGVALTLGILFITGALNSGTTVHSPFVAGTAVPVVADPPNISELAATAGQSLVTVAQVQPSGDMVQIATGISVVKDRVLTMARPLLAAGGTNLVIVSPGQQGDHRPDPRRRPRDRSRPAPGRRLRRARPPLGRARGRPRG